MVDIVYIFPQVIFVAAAFIFAGIFIIKLVAHPSSSSLINEFTSLPYRKKPFLLSASERKCYTVILSVLPEKYVVFPQINLDKIIFSTNRRYEHLNKIDRKSVDFVICSREHLSPVLAIELDDPTHLREDRIARDNFVNSALANAGLNLLRLHNSDLVDKTKFQNLIIQNLDTQP